MNAYMFWNAKQGSQMIIVAWCEDDAVAQYRQITGKVHLPRFTKPVIFATVSPEEGRAATLVGESPAGPYQTKDSDSFPLLSYLGPSGMTPDWVVNRKTGKVELAGEFQSIPKELLDLTGKPTPEEVLAGQGNRSGLDEMVAHVNEGMSWLNIQDAGDLLDRLSNECTQWEKRYAHETF